MQEENAGEKNKESFREWLNTQRSEDAYQQFLAEKKAEIEKEIQKEVDNGKAIYEDGILYNRQMTVLRECRNKNSVIKIPESVTVIEDGAFSSNRNLTSVIFPKSLCYIGYESFEDCTSLKSLTFPKGFKGIYISAFQGCTSLEKVNLPGTLEYLERQAFEGCPGYCKRAVS